MAFPLVPQPRPEPKIVATVAKRRTVARLDRAEKEAVRQRDHERCRVCGRRSREVHERLFKSRGGVASRQNSLVLDARCHRYVHAHAIQVRGISCELVLTFVMCAAVAHEIFRGRPTPRHVEILG